MRLSYFILSFILFSCFASNANAQNDFPPLAKSRPADYEYLSSPDSAGKRASLKTPSVRLHKSSVQQMLLPYPIIFIHGLSSSSEAWNPTTDSMDAQYGFTFGGRIDFCLNYDGSNSLSNSNFFPAPGADIALFTNPSSLSIGDYYYVNFDVGSNGATHPNGNSYDVKSNQQAIVKQGRALKWAINYVLQKTGRDKVVLAGHSMGGLASREYIQNLTQPDGQLHVAKLVTTGTPHGGSNVITAGVLYGPDGQSEAVRDLRTSYYYSHNPGVYLFGGIEDSAYMNDQACCYFYNTNVNCNGNNNTGESIIGLNQKNSTGNIDYACIIGECSGCGLSPGMPGDGVVSDSSANLKNYSPGLNINFFYYNAPASIQIHTDLPAQIYQNMQGLDDPNDYWLSYQINFDTVYAGFHTVQDSNSPYFPTDFDDYTFYVSGAASVNVLIDNIFLPDLYAQIVDSNYQVVGATHSSGGSSTLFFTEQLNKSGKYYLEIFGIPDSASYLSPYLFILSNTATGIKGLRNENDFLISPNPSDGKFFITTEAASAQTYIEIYNSLGQRITQSSIPVGAKNCIMDLQNQPDGIYFIKINSNSVNVTKKIIIRK